jgi:hypothetical protein
LKALLNAWAPRRRGRRAFRAAVLTLLTASLSVPGPGFSQTGPKPTALDLFQLIARSDLVALVSVHDGSLKYAQVDVVEALKGTPPAPRLRIDFRDFNFNRRPDEDMIVFPDNQKEILFLVPARTPRKKKDIEKYKDLFTLNRGRLGRITLPAEGPEIVLETIRTLEKIGRLDANSQITALKGALDSSNPFLLEESLAEIERLRAADPSLLNRLVSFLTSVSAALRERSLRLIAQVFAAERGSGDEHLDDARTALLAVLERAHNDADEAVRVQAVVTVAAWPNRRDVEGDLQGIAGTDRAQAVRYEAQKALLQH